MTLIVKIPHLNPLRFYRDRTEQQFIYTVPANEQAWLAAYCQKWDASDILSLQVHLKEKYWESCGAKIESYDNTVSDVLSGALVGFYEDDYRVWRLTSTDALSQASGLYRIKITVVVYPDGNGSPEVTEDWIYYSEWFYIDADHNEDTVLIEYAHDVNEFDLFFVAGASEYSFQLRIEAGMQSEGLTPSAKEQLYIDQERKVVLLDSVPFNVERWVFGSGRGIPNWMADKLNRILSCNNITIDGKSYVKNEGAKLEATRERLYPFAGWQIDLVSNDDFYSKTYSI